MANLSGLSRMFYQAEKTLSGWQRSRELWEDRSQDRQTYFGSESKPFNSADFESGEDSHAFLFELAEGCFLLDIFYLFSLIIMT